MDRSYGMSNSKDTLPYYTLAYYTKKHKQLSIKKGYCRTCGDEEELETIDHLLRHCPSMLEMRNRIIGQP